MHETEHDRIVKSAVRTRLANSRTIDPEKLDDVLAYAAKTLRLRLGRNGWGVPQDALDRFVRDAATRPGWAKPQPASVVPEVPKRNDDVHVMSAASFDALPPMERLRIANTSSVTRSSTDVQIRRKS